MRQLLIFCMLSLSASFSHAQEQMMDTFIEVFNQQERQKVADYMVKMISPQRTERFGIEAHIGSMLTRQQTFGQLKLIEHLGFDKNAEKALVQSHSNQFNYVLTINRTAEKPYKINFYTLTPPPEKIKELAPLSHNDFKQELGNFLDRVSSNDAFSGSVLVAKGNDVWLKKSLGYANRATKTANNIDTRFSLGSINKMFTALSALQLIEQEKLHFDDKLYQFISPDWLPEGAVKDITIRHLLTHTSGLSNFFNADFVKSNKEQYRDLNAYKPLIASTPLLFKPGTRNRYSNSGMLLLGLVVERVSGMSYYDYVQKNIYDKAKMVDSGSFELDSTTPNLATGYLKRAHSDDWVNSIYTRAIKGSPAGGGFSTVGDLFNYAKALTSYQLLGKALTEDAYTEKSKYNSAPWYGYGFGVYDTPNGKVVGHGGAYLGVDARLDIHLDSGFVVVILANQSSVVAPVRRKVNELIARTID